MVAHRKPAHARPDLAHNTSALVAKYCGESALRVCPRAGELVRMTNARCLDLYQHLACLRPFQIDLDNFERLSSLERYRSTCFHLVSFTV